MAGGVTDHAAGNATGNAAGATFDRFATFT